MRIPQVEDYLPMPIVLGAALVVFGLMAWVILFGRSWGRVGGIALLLLALAWVPLNKPVEGPILMRLGHDKGLVLADLLAIVVVLIACRRILFASGSERESERELSVFEAT